MQILNNKFFQTGVYAWKRNNEYLYIGHSINLIQRLGSHDVINHFEPFRDEDELELYFINSLEEAKKFEKHLLNLHKTKYNVNGQENYGKAQKLREEMIAMHNTGMSYRQIEARLGFKKSTVGKVIRGEGKHTLSRGPYTIKRKRIQKRLNRKAKLLSLPT